MTIELHDFVPPDYAIASGLLRQSTWVALNAWYEQSLLIVFNTSRSVPQWESVAGAIEPGESPEDAVRRELLEETSQVCGEVNFLGVLRATDPATGWISEPCALFSTTLYEVRPFKPNAEISAIEFVPNPQSQLTRFTRLTGQTLMLETRDGKSTGIAPASSTPLADESS